MTAAIEAAPAVAASKHHHASHRNLVDVLDTLPTGLCEVDAIIVPTARPAAYLAAAFELAAKLRCRLITLGSRRSRVGEVVELGRGSGVDLVAIDVTAPPATLLPSFETTNLLAGTMFARRTDTSLKRNLGLLLARLLDWKHVVFLDDDIHIPDYQHLTDAVRWLHQYDGVGLTIGGYPDNSVVCHAFRETGGFQDTFIGGGALAVDAVSCESFFPEIYNEDWFFLLDDTRLRPTAKTGGVAEQNPYDPFANERRARAEELGDCLAEGVFWLLDEGKRVQDADADYWLRFLDKRRRFINEVLDRAGTAPMDEATRGRMTAALKAARGRCELITPELCAQYLKAWRVDRGRWRRHIESWQGLVERPSVNEVLTRMKLGRSPRRSDR